MPVAEGKGSPVRPRLWPVPGTNLTRAMSFRRYGVLARDPRTVFRSMYAQRMLGRRVVVGGEPFGIPTEWI